jgi:peptide/nickel transport system permease protein
VRRFVLKRLAAGVVLLFAISLLTFVLLSLGAGNVGRTLLGVTATTEQVAEKNHDLGIDKPLVVQYGVWLSNAVRGDLGDSWSKGDRVWSLLQYRAPITITIVGLSVLLAIILATVLGVAAALRGRGFDRATQTISTVGFAVPGYLIAFFLVWQFSIRWKIFRATGYTRPSEGTGEWLRSVTLPVLALHFASLANLMLQVRGSVKDALALDYVRTLRSRGLSSRRTVFKHILRNAAGPALAVVGVQIIGLLGGAVIVEQVFNIPGIGAYAIQAAGASDVPLVMGIVLITAVLVVVVNLIIDVLSAWLNPKMRLA